MKNKKSTFSAKDLVSFGTLVTLLKVLLENTDNILKIVDRLF